MSPAAAFGLFNPTVPSFSEMLTMLKNVKE